MDKWINKQMNKQKNLPRGKYHFSMIIFAKTFITPPLKLSENKIFKGIIDFSSNGIFILYGFKIFKDTYFDEQ